MFLNAININAQKVDRQSVEKYIELMYRVRGKIINKDIANLFSVMGEYNIKFITYSANFTSPWTEESKGKAYVDEIHLALVDIYNLDDNARYHCFVITPAEKIEYDYFVKKGGFYDARNLLTSFKNVKIKNIYYHVDY